jgi:hypothetical protein
MTQSGASSIHIREFGMSLFAFGHPTDLTYALVLVFAAGVSLLYADNKASRVAGLLIATAAALSSSGRSAGGDWAVGATLVASAFVVLLIFRPTWLRR